MSSFVQRSFASGEIAPSLYSRVDMSKYSSGLRTCKNFLIQRQGGAANRPGTVFVGEVKDSTKTVRLIPFIFNADQTYVLEFGNSYMRVIQNGTHLVDLELVITAATQADPVVVTSAAHGLSNGDEVYISGVAGMTQLNNRNFKVNNVASNTFELQHMDSTDVDGAAFGAYTSGGSADRIYTLATPYAEADLMELQYVQSADVITIVHHNYAPQELARLDHTSWTLTEITFVPSLSAPTNVAVSGTGGSVEEWVVTSVKAETFEESLPSGSAGANAVASSGSPRTITWTAAPSAASYNVYKTKNGVYGFIGTAVGTQFVDNGITADTTDTPPSLSGIISNLVFGLEKLDDPATLPAGSGIGIARSADDQFWAVAHNTTPFVTIYQKVGTTFTKLTNPANLPAGDGNGVAWSLSGWGQFLAVAHVTTPFVTVYQQSGTTFTKLSNPATLPGGTGNGVAWSNVGGGAIVYFAVAHIGTPFVSIYRIDGGPSLTKLTNPATLPAGTGNGVAWSSGAEFLAVAHNTTPFITIYERGPGSTFTKLSNPAALPAGHGNGVAWSHDDQFLAVAHGTTPFITIYQRSGTTFTKLADPAVPPADVGNGCSWSSDDQFLTVAHDASPFVSVYQRSGTTFTKLPDPVTLPAEDGNGIVLSSDDQFLAVAHDTTPFIAIYEDVSANPSAVSYAQQRLLLANTIEEPEKVWGSKTGSFHNFTLSSPLQDDDAISFKMAGRQVNAVKHMIQLGTLVILTSGGEWSIEGDTAGIIRPGEINPKQQGYTGSSDLSPIIVGGNALYVQARGSIVRDLSFSFEADGYRGNDLTIFSAHMFDLYTLLDWAYQQIPHSVVWVVRNDGTLLGLTYIREHQMWAWHRHDFDGTIENVCCVPEGNEDALYVVIKRTIDGATKRYIERMRTRQIDDVVDAVFMDCALSYDGRHTGVTTMTLSGGTTWVYTETLTLTASESTFAASDVGNQIHLTGADGTLIRFTITGFTGVTIVTGTAHKTVPAGMRSVAITQWARAVDQLTGLWHLEGKEVSVFADGFVVASPNNESYDVLTVTDGAVTLDQPYGVIHAGLPYISDLETLDIDTPQGETVADKKKIISRVSAFVESSRGIFAGPKPPSDDDADPLEGLMEFKLRNEEGYDDPVSLATGVVEVNIQPEWNSNGRIFIRQIDPLPLSVLAVVPAGSVPFRS